MKKKAYETPDLELIRLKLGRIMSESDEFDPEGPIHEGGGGGPIED